MMDVRQAEIEIRTHIVGEFEERFFDACLANLKDKGNPLRFNNFAYAMRELIRNVFSRLAPDEEVEGAPWFVREKGTKGITRLQRMKYAVQGWLSDETMCNELHMDITSSLENLKQSIDDLSKYTHVGPETFDVPKEEVDVMVADVLSCAAKVFSLIKKTREAVHDAVWECVNEDMIQQFYQTTNPDIDELASHYEIERFWVTDISKTDDGDGCVHVEVEGSIDVRLQYGSDGDMRRDIGWETEESFLFTAVIEVSYKNEYGDIRVIEDGDYQVDTNSDFEDSMYDEDIIK